MSVRRAIAVAAVALALPAAAAAAPVYRGSAHGVTCVLRASTLTITFGKRSDALLRRAAKSPGTVAFLEWPAPAVGRMPDPRASWFGEEVTVDVGRRRVQLTLEHTPESSGFLCGLDPPAVPNLGSSPVSDYLGHPIVVVRLTRAG